MFNFWHTLPRPIIGLSPMDGITDHPYRHIQKKYGHPMVVYTEFTPVEGICFGETRLLKDFLYDESQRPIVAQIFGHTPDLFRQSAVVLCQLGFDGIDINMGCPAKKIADRGSGAALIRTPELAQEIVRATRAGVQDWCDGRTVDDCEDVRNEIATEVKQRHQLLPAVYQHRRPIPVSVKTRIGYDDPDIEPWVASLLEVEPVVLALHGRTLTQGYAGKADWDVIGRAAEMTRQSGTLLLGNGDVRSLKDARRRVETYGVDGVLIGRASFGNPFVFRGDEADKDYDPYQRLHIALEHLKLHQETALKFGPYYIDSMRKHLSWYVRGVPGAGRLRRELAQAKCPRAVTTIFDDYFAYRRRWEETESISRS